MLKQMVLSLSDNAEPLQALSVPANATNAINDAMASRAHAAQYPVEVPLIGGAKKAAAKPKKAAAEKPKKAAAEKPKKAAAEKPKKVAENPKKAVEKPTKAAEKPKKAAKKPKKAAAEKPKKAVKSFVC